MPPGIGYGRDIPLASEGAGGPQGQRPQGLSPQEAVKLLSLRIPEQPAAGAIAPLPLLTSPGGAVPGGGGGLEALLTNLIAAFQPPANPAQPFSGFQPQTIPAPPIPPSAIAELPDRGGGGLGRGDTPQVPTFLPSPASPRRPQAPPRQPQPIQQANQARPALPPLDYDSPEVQQFLRNNPGDFGRAESALGRPVLPRITFDRPPVPSFTFEDGEDLPITGLF